MARASGMEKISSILSRIKLPGPGPLHLGQIQDAVRAELGEAGARDVRVASYRAGRLVLECSSSARAFEWQAFARADLLARLKHRPGLETLTEVNFKNGAWSRHGRQ
jgi:hypothetical protein